MSVKSPPHPVPNVPTIPPDQASFFGHHRQAERLSVEAAAALAAGRRADAAALYRDAAEHERRAFAEIPADKTRTWGVVAVSVASLLYKSRQLSEAEKFLYIVMSRPDLSSRAFSELRGILDAVRDEEALPAGMVYGEREISFVLRGGRVGTGTAPIDLVLEKGAAIRSYLARGVELVGGQELRRSGLPRPEVSRFIHARVTQPTAGSYRFSVKLVEPEQLSLPNASPLDPPQITAAEVGDTLFDFASAAVQRSAGAQDQLRELVPDEGYRIALLQLLRNIAPSKNEVEEVQIAYGRPSPTGPVLAERIDLARSSRGVLNEAIAATRLTNEPTEGGQIEKLHGRLRALNLDHRQLGVKSDDGRTVQVWTDEQTVDDTIGPFVNKTVEISVVKVRTSAGAERYILRDIDLYEPSADS